MTHYIVINENEIVKAEMERPNKFAYSPHGYSHALNVFEKHRLSLPRIAIQGKHNWEVWQEVVEDKDFRLDKWFVSGNYHNICVQCKKEFSGSDKLWFLCPEHSPIVAIPIQPTPEGEKVEDYYPGYQYQRLFNAIHSTGGTALQGEMDEIIRIVHKDFPLNNDNPQTP